MKTKIVRLRARCIGGIVQGGATNADAGVVLAKRNWIAAAAEALVGPEQLVLLTFVSGEVTRRRPVAAGLKRHDAQARPRKPRQERRAPGSRSDHDRVHHLVGGV
jgi:hypothetical protein